MDNLEWHAHDKRCVQKTKGVLSKSDAYNQGKNDGHSW